MSSAHALRMRLAPWALLAVSASWGLAFVVMKDAIERQSVNSFLFSRFLLAVLVMLLIKPSVLKAINGDNPSVPVLGTKVPIFTVCVLALVSVVPAA